MKVPVLSSLILFHARQAGGMGIILYSPLVEGPVPTRAEREREGERREREREKQKEKRERERER